MTPAVAQRWPERTTLERLAEKYVVDEATGCWRWTAYTDAAGYGRLNVGGESRVAHRVAYEALVGPIPDGLTLDHLCRNRACVNPAHLEPVTLAENKARGESLPAQNARKTHCPRGHAYDEANAYRSAEGYRACRRCRRDARRQAVAAVRAERPVRYCAAPGCSKAIPSEARIDKQTCSSACNQRARRAAS